MDEDMFDIRWLVLSSSSKHAEFKSLLTISKIIAKVYIGIVILVIFSFLVLSSTRTHEVNKSVSRVCVV